MYRHLDTLNTETYTMIIWKNSLVWSMTATGNHIVEFIDRNPERRRPSLHVSCEYERNTKIHRMPPIAKQQGYNES